VPLIDKIQLDPHTKLGLWRIEEPSHALRPFLVFSRSEEEFMSRVTNEDRRTQWMASRVLLKRLLDTTSFVDIYVDQYGRPEMQNFDYRMSISHSRDYSAVILSDRYTVGVDVESMRHDLARLKNKFMRPDELALTPPDHSLAYVLLHWSAKEVMYKIYYRRKLDFREHMGVEPFDLEGNLDEGQFWGWVRKGEYDRRFLLQYRRLVDYYVVWAVDTESADE
jgi:phosphopantetheinyl transferase (holo-ACP synthase)